ncbi:hypothetical protein ACFL35_16150, partial [Candidatus Riflebacteria bacterium]
QLQEKCHPQQKRRILRYLEILLATGKTWEQLAAEQKNTIVLSNVLVFKVLPKNKEALYQNIEKRTKKMVKDGILAETRNLLKKYPCYQFLKSVIGYRECIQVLEDKMSEAELAAEINKKTRAYAKRQYTWFKKRPSGIILDSLSLEDNLETIFAVLAKTEHH